MPTGLMLRMLVPRAADQHVSAAATSRRSSDEIARGNP